MTTADYFSPEARANRRSASAKRGAKTRADSKIIEAYCTRFGAFAGWLTPKVVETMAGSLATGIDQLVAEKAKQEELSAANLRKHKEYLAQPITDDVAHGYTGLIKTRRLYDGACMLNWPKYFEHPDSATLSADDLAYAAQWTSCAVRAN